MAFGLVGVLASFAGIYYSKKMATRFGQEEIDKTLSAIDKFKTMQEQGAFDFKLSDLDPKLVTPLSADSTSNPVVLSDYKGNIILLNFWASWCEPCIQEFPDMIRLVEKQPRVKIVAVNRDTNKEDALKFIDSFPESKGKIHFYWDQKGEITALYGTEVLPESYLIGSDFKALRKIVGIEDWDHPDVLRFINNLQ